MTHAATAQQAIALLNAQRAGNGLPANIIEDPRLTGDCAAHDHYMALNHRLTHFEQAGDPGYTVGGAYAGKNSVLSQRATWDNGNPYESAPLHLDQLLAPRLTSLGSADVDGYSCTTTFPGWTGPDPAAPTVYTYPGDGSTIYPSELAGEQPWTPGELVGIPHASRTGPYLLVFVDAPGQSPLADPATLSAATLEGPTGPIGLKTADGATPVPGGGALGPYLYPGGFIIPAKPAEPGSQLPRPRGRQLRRRADAPRLVVHGQRRRSSQQAQRQAREAVIRFALAAARPGHVHPLRWPPRTRAGDPSGRERPPVAEPGQLAGLRPSAGHARVRKL